MKSKQESRAKSTLANIIRIFNGRNDAIKFIESYGQKILESKRLTKQGTGLF